MTSSVMTREVAVEYLSQCDDVEVAGQCANGYEAVKAVSGDMPDVLLLDVQMPRLSGFDVLELIGLADRAASKPRSFQAG